MSPKCSQRMKPTSVCLPKLVIVNIFIYKINEYAQNITTINNLCSRDTNSSCRTILIESSSTRNNYCCVPSVNTVAILCFFWSRIASRIRTRVLLFSSLVYLSYLFFSSLIYTNQVYTTIRTIQ